MHRLIFAIQWTGNCIGARNYKYFLSFLFSVTLFNDLSLGLCVWVLTRDHHELSASVALRENLVACIIGAVTLLFCTALTPLSAYHVYLLSRGLTTFEEVKHFFPDDVHPDNRGCLLNTLTVCCGQRTRSKLPQMHEKIPIETYLATLGYKL